jgi:hypothetical protein
MKTKLRGALRSDEEVVANLNTQFEAKRFNWSNGYSSHLFRNPENIYSEWSIGLTLPISAYVDFITTNVSRRKNHKTQSLLLKRRDDYKLDFGLIKTLQLSEIGIVLEAKQTFNKSSIDFFLTVKRTSNLVLNCNLGIIKANTSFENLARGSRSETLGPRIWVL